MKRGLKVFILFVLIGSNAYAQETLQTVTDRGNSTSRGILINPVFEYGSRITAYGVGSGYFDLYNNSNNSISLALKRSDGASVFEIDGHKMYSYFGGNVGIGTTEPESKLNVNIGAGGANGTVGLRIGGVSNYPSLEFGIENDYDGMIKTYGNDLKIYAGNWKSIGATASENHTIYFHTSKAGSTNWSIPKMVLNHEGNLGIGISSPSDKLAVNGNIRAREIKVEATNWPDYVFTKSYRLPTLEETENHIKEKGHLPGIPSAAEVKANGIDLGEMNAKLLQKIEELTLHLIENKKETDLFKNTIEELKKENQMFKSTLQEIILKLK